MERPGDLWVARVDGVGPGQRYGLRAAGPWDPAQGQRFDPAKLLLDPYSHAITGELGDHPSLQTRGSDTLGRVPLAVVTDDAFPWGADPRPDVPAAQAVRYEVHVRQATMRHPDVPPELRGTYAGLAHPAVTEHLTSLGVTTVELLPVHHFVSERHLLRRGMVNAWGYNTLGWLAPHAGYSSRGSRGGQVHDIKAMVRALHRAGLQVMLDVVYNHTAEGGADGPTLSLRGLGDGAWYRTDGGRYIDVTGGGNTLDTRRPVALQLVLDSLRWWVEQVHVDGFRFDLATALSRSADGFDRGSAFLLAVAQDPVLSTVDLVAEPWDLGPGGYQVGGFPHPWAEWNGPLRDTLRSYWLGGTHGARGELRNLGQRLTGSADLYAGRGPAGGTGFVTAHDGFTLADLVSYSGKHNEANGEDGRDGTDDNRSSNVGVEGPTGDATVLAARRRLRRALLATLLLSAGTPMLLAGDELGRTQAGNNNAYCQDGEVTWLDWSPDAGERDPAGADPLLVPLVRALTGLRRSSPVLRPHRFATGGAVTGAPADVGWFRFDGAVMTEDDWAAPVDGCVVISLASGGDGPSYLLALNPTARDAPVRWPPAPWPQPELVVLDTTADDPTAEAPVPSVSPARSCSWCDQGGRRRARWCSAQPVVTRSSRPSRKTSSPRPAGTPVTCSCSVAASQAAKLARTPGARVHRRAQKACRSSRCPGPSRSTPQ